MPIGGGSARDVTFTARLNISEAERQAQRLAETLRALSDNAQGGDASAVERQLQQERAAAQERIEQERRLTSTVKTENRERIEAAIHAQRMQMEEERRHTATTNAEIRERQAAARQARQMELQEGRLIGQALIEEERRLTVVMKAENQERMSSIKYAHQAQLQQDKLLGQALIEEERRLTSVTKAEAQERATAAKHAQQVQMEQERRLTIDARSEANERSQSVRLMAARKIEESRRSSLAEAEEERRLTEIVKVEMRERADAARHAQRLQIEQERRLTAETLSEIRKREAAERRSVTQPRQRNLLSTARGLALGAAGALGVTIGARETAEYAAKLSQLRVEAGLTKKALEGLSGSETAMRRNTEAVIDVLGRSIDEMQARKLATTALATGLADGAEDLQRLTRAAAGAASVSPVLHDVSDAFGELQLTIANMSFRRLDQLGLGVTETKNRMAELQAANVSLSQEAAFQEAVVSLLEEKYGHLADQMKANTSGAESLASAWRDLQVALAEGSAGQAAERALENTAYSLRMYSGALTKTEELGAALEGLAQRMPTNQTRQYSDELSELEDVMSDVIREMEGGREITDGLASSLEQQANNAAIGVVRHDELVSVLTEARAWMADSGRAADQYSDSLSNLATQAYVTANSIASLSAQQMLAAQRAGMMTPGEQERRATSSAVQKKSAADYEREYYLLRRDEEAKLAEEQKREQEKATKAWSSAGRTVADDWSRQLESALRSVSGVFDASAVTAQDLADAKAGKYTEKADEYLRRLRDEIQTGKDWEDVSVEDAAKRLGIDAASTTAEEVLRQFEAAWNDSSLFAGGANMDLFNTEAIEREVERQKASKAGEEAIISYFEALYGPGVAQEALGYQSSPGGSYARPYAATDAPGALTVNGIDPESLDRLLTGQDIEIAVTPTLAEGSAADLMAEYAAALRLQIENNGSVSKDLMQGGRVLAGYIRTGMGQTLKGDGGDPDQINSTSSLMAEFASLLRTGADNEHVVAKALAAGSQLGNLVGAGLLNSVAATEADDGIAAAYLDAIERQFLSEAGAVAAGSIGVTIKSGIAASLMNGETLPPIAQAMLRAMEAQVASEENSTAAMGIGAKYRALITAGLLASGSVSEPGAAGTSLAMEYLTTIERQFLSQEASEKAGAIAGTIKGGISAGLMNAESMPPVAMSMLAAIRAQTGLEDVQAEAMAVGEAIIAHVHGGWAAGAPELDWLGPILSSAYSQAAAYEADAAAAAAQAANQWGSTPGMN